MSIIKSFISPSRLFLFLCLFLLVGAGSGQAGADAGSATVSVLGDSLTAGYGLARENSFPAQLERALREDGYHVRVLNAGVSGDTTAGGLARLAWVLADRPDLVIVELGGNDALRGLAPAGVAANLDAIIERLKSAGVAVLLTGMQAPRNLGEPYYTSFDRIYPDLAERHEVAFYPFFLAGVATNPDLNQPDGIHPTARGVAVIVENLLPLVKSELDRLEAKSAVPVQDAAK